MQKNLYSRRGEEGGSYKVGTISCEFDLKKLAPTRPGFDAAVNMGWTISQSEMFSKCHRSKYINVNRK